MIAFDNVQHEQAYVEARGRHGEIMKWKKKLINSEIKFPIYVNVGMGISKLDGVY